MVVAAVARWTLGGGCGGGGVVAATPCWWRLVTVAEVAVVCADALLCACVHVRGRVCESLRACVRRDCVWHAPTVKHLSAASVLPRTSAHLQDTSARG